MYRLKLNKSETKFISLPPYNFLLKSLFFSITNKATGFYIVKQNNLTFIKTFFDVILIKSRLERLSNRVLLKTNKVFTNKINIKRLVIQYKHDF